MKTYKNLYPKIHTFRRLYESFCLCRKDKRDQSYVAEFERNLEERLFALQHDLIDRTWEPDEYATFTVSDPKRRLINAPSFRDRIVHRAIHDTIVPIWECRFIHDSYACRKGKGPHVGADRLQGFMQTFPKGDGYYLQADVKSYFATIDHAVLLDLLWYRIADRDLRGILEQVVHSYHTPGCRGIGIPLGNLTSQLFANIYLHELDMFVKHRLRVRHYIRYMDDIVLLSDSKPQLWEWRDAIGAFLEDRLRVRLHPKKQIVAPIRTGTDYLGYWIFQDRRWVRARNVHRFYGRLKRMEAGAYPRDPMSSIMSWMGYAIHADAYGLNKSIERRHPFLAAGTERFYRQDV